MLLQLNPHLPSASVYNNMAIGYFMAGTAIGGRQQEQCGSTRRIRGRLNVNQDTLMAQENNESWQAGEIMEEEV